MHAFLEGSGYGPSDLHETTTPPSLHDITEFFINKQPANLEDNTVNDKLPTSPLPDIERDPVPTAKTYNFLNIKFESNQDEVM